MWVLHVDSPTAGGKRRGYCVEHMVLVGEVLLAIAAIALLRVFLQKGGKRSLPYIACENLVTAAERRFLGALDHAIGDRYRVFAKVRVADLIRVRPLHNRSAQRTALNRIASKHVDFVLCDPDSLAVVAAIELNDKSHEAADRRRRDQFLKDAFAVAGVPLIFVAAKREYEVERLREQIAVGTAVAPASEPAAKPAMRPRNKGHTRG